MKEIQTRLKILRIAILLTGVWALVVGDANSKLDAGNSNSPTKAAGSAVH